MGGLEIQAGGYSSLTPEVHVQGHVKRCGGVAAASIAPVSGATHVAKRAHRYRKNSSACSRT
jgi:hypothetical protein